MLDRGLMAALVASLALHGAAFGLWLLWPWGGPRSHDDAWRAGAGVIEVVLAALPAAPAGGGAEETSAPAPGQAREPAPESLSERVPEALPRAQGLTAPAPAQARDDARPIATPGIKPAYHAPPVAATDGAATGGTATGANEPPVTRAAAHGPPATVAGTAPPAATAAETSPKDAGAGAGEGGDAAAGSAAAAGGDALPPRYALGTAANPAPSYPLAARYEGAEGRVVLRVRVDASGTVRAIALAATSGHPILDRAAMEAVRRWRFEPARAAGLPVPGEVDVPIQFRLRS